MDIYEPGNCTVEECPFGSTCKEELCRISFQVGVQFWFCLSESVSNDLYTMH
jgi:hypothetical protein